MSKGERIRAGRSRAALISKRQDKRLAYVTRLAIMRRRRDQEAVNAEA